MNKQLKNVLRIPLYGLSFLIPRNPDKWVVGNGTGFNNNSKYFFIHAKTVLCKEQCYWISRNKRSIEKVRSLGFKAYKPWSVKGVYHLLTACVYIYDSHVSSLNYWTSGGARYVNLWHGIGIKNIEFKSRLSPYKLHSFPAWLRQPGRYVRPDLLLSTSALITAHFSECFRIPPGNCIESDYPRCEIFKMSREKLIRSIRRFEDQETLNVIERIGRSDKTIIYMPTWRDKNADFLNESGIDLTRLDEMLKAKNELFIYKVHPFTKFSFDESLYSQIILLDHLTDIYPILPFTDILVTDYSSIYFDYLLIENSSVLLFPFDYERYVSKDRDLAFGYNEFMPGKKAFTFEELLAILRDDVSLECREQKYIKSLFWDSPEKTNLYEAIDKLAHGNTKQQYGKI